MKEKTMLNDLGLKNFLLTIFACLLWSTAFVGVKIGLNYMTPLAFAGIRFMLSGLILVPFVGNFPLFLSTVKNNFRIILVIGLLQTFLAYGLFFTGISIVPGALAAIIIGSSPLAVAIVAHFTMDNDVMTLKKISSILLGLLGIVILTLSRKPWQAAGKQEFVGIVILLLCVISSAFGNIAIAKTKNTISPLILNSSQLFFGGLGLIIVSIFFEGIPNIFLPLNFYLILSWLSILSAIAISIWFHLLKIPNIKVSDLNLWKFIIPVFGALLTWIILPEESPDIYSILGILLVGGGIIAYNVGKK